MMKNFFLAFFLAVAAFSPELQAQPQNPQFAQVWFAQLEQLSGVYEIITPLSPTVATTHRNGKFGLVHIDGHEIHPSEFDAVQPYSDRFIILKKSNRCYIADFTGKIISKREYDDAFHDTDWGVPYIAAMKDSITDVLDVSGKVLVSIPARTIYAIGENAVAASNNNKAGLWNMNGRQIIAEQFDLATPAPGGYWVVSKYHQSALLGPDMHLKTDFRYDRIIPFADGTFLASVVNSNLGKYRWYNRDMTLRTDSFYYCSQGYNYAGGWYISSADGQHHYLLDKKCLLTNFHENTIQKIPLEAYPGCGLLVTTSENRDINHEGNYFTHQFGWYDEKEKISVAPQYKKVIFRNDKIYAASEGKTEIFDRKNRLIRSFPFFVNLDETDFLWVYSEYNSAQGICDTNFQIIYQAPEPQYINRENWGGFSTHESSRGAVFIDPLGRQYNNDRKFRPDLSYNKYEVYGPNSVKKLMSPDGTKVIVEGYDYCYSNDNGENFVVRKNGLYGYYSKAGVELAPPKYDEIQFIIKNCLQLRLGKTKIIVNTQTGKPVIPEGYSNITPLMNNRIIAKKDGFYTLFDTEGKVASDWKIDTVVQFWDMFYIKKEGKWGIVDMYFNVTAPFEYSKIENQGYLIWAASATGKNLLFRGKKGFKKLRMDDARIDLCYRTRLFAGKSDGKWALYSETGQQISKKSYDEVLPAGFQGVLAIARQGTDIFTLDVNGEETKMPDQADGLIDVYSTCIRYSKNNRVILRSLSNNTAYEIPDGKLTLITETDLVKLENNNSTWVYSLAGPTAPLSTNDPIYETSSTGRKWLIMKQTTGWGILNDVGGIALPFEYKYINTWEEFRNDIYYLGESGETGFYNLRTGVLLPPLYTSFQWVNNGSHLVVFKDDKAALFSAEAKQLTPFLYEAIDTLQRNTFWATKGGKTGILDEKGVEITPFVIDEILSSPAPELPFIPFRQGELQGVLHRNGKMVIPAQYSGVRILSAQIIGVKNSQEEWNLFNARGQKIIQSTFSDVSAVGDVYYVRKNELKGLLTEKGQFAVTLRPGLTYCVNYGCIVRNNEQFGLIDLRGKHLLETAYDLMVALGNTEDLFEVSKNKKTGIYSALSRKWVLAQEYDYIGDYFVKDLIRVRKGNVWGYADKSGNLVIPPQFQYAENFCDADKTAAVLLDHKWISINLSGRIIDTLPDNPSLKYKCFGEGLPHINIGPETEVKNFFGQVILPIYGYWLNPMVPGYMVYSKSGSDPFGLKPPLGIINYAGKEITPPVYDKILNGYRLNYSPLIPVRKDGRWGFIDFTGKAIVPTIYDRVEIEQQNDRDNPIPWRGQVELNGEWWRIDETGKRLEGN